MTRRVALVVATIGSFLTPFMGSSVNIALPPIGKEFSMDAVQLSWVAMVFLLAAAIFLVPFGKIADIYGRKKVYGYGMALYALSSFLCSLAPTSHLLIIFRVLQGIGGAMIFGTGIAILTSVYPPGDRGRALGINVAAVYLGLSIGPFVGGFMTQHWGWRSVFLSNGILGIALVALVVWKLKGEWTGARGDRFDLGGSLIYGLMLVSLMYGFSLLPAARALWWIVPGALGFAAFILWESRISHPLLSMALFARNRVFALSNVAALLNYSATFAVGFLLSLYLQDIRGMSPQDAGLIMVAQPIVMAVFSPLAGRLSDRVESRIVASAGMAVTVLGLALLAFVDERTDLLFIVGSLMTLGLGFALFSSPNTNAVMGSVEKNVYGVASATLGTMRLTGQIVSMAIAMMLFAVFVGEVEITPEYAIPFMHSIQIAFIIFAAMCFGGIFASLARGRVR